MKMLRTNRFQNHQKVTLHSDKNHGPMVYGVCINTYPKIMTQWSLSSVRTQLPHPAG